MSDAQQELVDVIAEALSDMVVLAETDLPDIATAALSALIARFGEPEIDLYVKQEVVNNAWVNTPLRRLVFPWMQVER